MHRPKRSKTIILLGAQRFSRGHDWPFKFSPAERNKMTEVLLR